ncbi:hypothetical protein EIP91_005717 [Steccherinum ochraceum]|uniref:Uncharacterized protein n=1 Tax=Steccherinum ochraceum TaxID=92696 RepID=A0A4R0RRL7_9APHY|nr:hypothetical protein EIP91_005717 [Steccherinum ochraceum]
MMFKSFIAVLAAASAVVAGPVTRATLDVWDPKITNPTAGQVWAIGNKQLVAWDLNSIPSSEYNKTGMLLLGYIANDSENLDIKHPLATGFSIGDGNVTVTVPEVQERDNYVVALLGDSGNISPQFSIITAPVPSTLSDSDQ